MLNKLINLKDSFITSVAKIAIILLKLNVKESCICGLLLMAITKAIIRTAKNKMLRKVVSMAYGYHTIFDLLPRSSISYISDEPMKI